VLVPVKDVPNGEKLLPSHMFCKPKHDATGDFDKLKSRLVGGGNHIDYSTYEIKEISSPTPAIETFNAIIATATDNEAIIGATDIPGAYLNAKLNRKHYVRIQKELVEILLEYMPQYAEYVQSDGSMNTVALQALYGFPESSVQWYLEISKDINDMGFKTSTYDKCLFHRKIHGDKIETIMVYVDDIFYILRDKNSETKLIRILESKYGKLKVQKLEDGISYIGFMIEKDTSTGDILVSMPKHIESVTEGYVKTAVTPATEQLYTDDTENLPCDRRAYLSLLMKIYYIAIRYRYENLFSLSTLGSRARSPTIKDMRCLQRILEYLKTTKDYKIRYKGRKYNKSNIVYLRVYVDASHAIHDDSKGHTGVLIILDGIGVIMAKSWKQKSVTTSSTHSELLALYDAITRTILWINNIYEEIGFTVCPITIYQDNCSAKYVVENKNIKSNKLRHIKIKYDYLQELAEDKVIKLERVPTEDMMADGLTKVITGKYFKKFIKYIYSLE
jgi:hypothetical protein